MRDAVPVVFVCAVALATLAGCSGGGGGGDGTISFAAAAFSQNEDGTATGLEVTIQRVGGTGAVSITLQLSNGTATAGADYDGSPILVTWIAGDTTDKQITVPVIDDAIDEQPGETVNLALTSPTGGATIGAPAAAVLTIVDDDEAGTIQFSAASYSYLEDGTPNLTAVTVQRVGGLDGAISAVVSSTDGTANSDPASLVEPVDYIPVNLVVNFADQDATDVVLNLAPNFIEDPRPEQDETFALHLASPTNGAAIGPQASTEVTITNTDLSLMIPNPTDELNGFFGSSVARVGASLAIGAPGSNAPAGQVFMYTFSNGPTVAVGFDQPFTQAFGTAVAPDGLRLLVGATNGAWLFSSGLEPQFPFTSGLDGFGTSLISLLDGRIVIGAPLANDGGEPAGALHVYSGATGALLQEIGGKGGEHFGTDFAVLGSSLLVGAPGGLGSVHRYSGNPLGLTNVINNPFPAAGPSPEFGAAVALLGETVIVGAPDEDTFAENDGRVYLISDHDTLTILPPGGIVPNGRFGAQIAIVAGRICVQEPGGGPSAMGRVHVFDAAGAFLTTIDASPVAPGAGFGASMCEYDGALVAGAPRHPFLLQSGSVFIVAIP